MRTVCERALHAWDRCHSGCVYVPAAAPWHLTLIPWSMYTHEARLPLSLHVMSSSLQLSTLLPSRQLEDCIVS